MSKLSIAKANSRLTKEYVYMAQAGGYFKIGRSVDPGRRIKGIQTSNAHEVKLISTLEFRNAAKMERQIHKIFKNASIRGEWFLLAPEQYEFFIYRFEKYIRFYNNPIFSEEVLYPEFSPLPTSERRRYHKENLDKYRQLKRKEAARVEREKPYNRIKMPFGKFKGRKLHICLSEDPDYFLWMVENFDGKERYKILFNHIEANLPNYYSE